MYDSNTLPPTLLPNERLFGEETIPTAMREARDVSADTSVAKRPYVISLYTRVPYVSAMLFIYILYIYSLMFTSNIYMLVVRRRCLLFPFAIHMTSSLWKFLINRLLCFKENKYVISSVLQLCQYTNNMDPHNYNKTYSFRQTFFFILPPAPSIDYVYCNVPCLASISGNLLQRTNTLVNSATRPLVH